MSNDRWIDKNASAIQGIAAIVQSVIACLMLWTLIQTQQNIKITKCQLEASIEPVIDMQMNGSAVRLKNTGSIEIRNVEKIAFIAAWFDVTTGTIQESEVARTQWPICDVMKSGQTLDVSLSQDLLPIPTTEEGRQLANKCIALHCLVLRYRRSADLHPFIMLVPFSVAKDTKTGKIDIYMPLFPSPGSTESGPTALWWTERQQLIDLYRTKVRQLDI